MLRGLLVDHHTRIGPVVSARFDLTATMSGNGAGGAAPLTSPSLVRFQHEDNSRDH